MIFKCPGQDNRSLKSETLRCPECSYEVEIFSDEVRVRCPKCARLVCASRLPSCVDWCKSARECLGKEKYKQLKGE